MHTFIVNLKRSTERKAYMEKLMKDFPYSYEFFEAVDGREIKNLNEVYDEKKAIRFHKEPLKLGEIGCALSHLKIYKKMIDENIDKALILEDDVIFKKDFYKVLAEIKNYPMNNDIFLLGHSGTLIRKKLFGKKFYQNYSLKQIKKSGNGTFAYMLDLRAAKKLHSFNFPIKLPADGWRVFSDFVNIYIMEPIIVDFRIDNYHSIINEIDDRWSDKPSFFFVLKKSQSMSLFLRFCFGEVIRIVQAVNRRVTWLIEFVFFSLTPEKRIE